jgi:hypothetical protein
MPRQPDDAHARPDGVDDATVEAAGLVGEAYEWVIRARGSLYDFHQQMGRADLIAGQAVERLREAGHDELADELARDWVGRNAITDRWTFEIVEDFDRTYFDVATASERRVRDQLVGGRHHVHEAEMKAGRRQDGPTEDAV